MFGYMLGKDGVFASTAYFSEDNIAAFYLPSLNGLIYTLSETVTNAANHNGVTLLKYQQNKGNNIDEKDLANVDEMFTKLKLLTSTVPSSMSFIMNYALGEMSRRAKALDGQDLTDQDVQEEALLLARGAVGIVIAVDFFSEKYPAGEPFLDQSYSADDINHIDSEPFPTASPQGSSVETSQPFIQPMNKPVVPPASAPMLQPIAKPVPGGNTNNKNNDKNGSGKNPGGQKPKPRAPVAAPQAKPDVKPGESKPGEKPNDSIQSPTASPVVAMPVTRTRFPTRPPKRTSSATAAPTAASSPPLLVLLALLLLL